MIYLTDSIRKYPKLILLFLTFVGAYFLFQIRHIAPFYIWLETLGYVGTFIAGALFVYGFTAAPATALLLILSPTQNIIIAAAIAGVGALAGDLFIFRFIKHSFHEEMHYLVNEKIVYAVHSRIPKKIKRYVILLLAGLIICSPLPDEIGIFLLAAAKKVSTRLFSVLSYSLNTLGILIILWIGKWI